MSSRKARAHFKKNDPVLFSAAKDVRLDDVKARAPADYFSSLCREVIGQQLSGKVARVIFGWFEDLFTKKRINSKAVVKLPTENLRGAGMAWSKAKSIKDLAERVENKSLKLKSLETLDDQSVRGELIKVKGIGPWTAEMFLMFTLGREDVFSLGDLALRRSITKLYGLKDPTHNEILEISKNWSPYRTYACLALWNLVDTD